MKTGRVCFGQNCFEVEVAHSILEKSKGLSGRRNLDENKGMFFEFSFSFIHAFTMKNTLIPLDIIWLDKNLKVVDIRENCEPCKSFFCPAVIPKKPAKYVLEINAGLCRELGIKVGSLGKTE